MKSKRCGLRGFEAEQCIKPKGHKGEHAMGYLIEDSADEKRVKRRIAAAVRKAVKAERERCVEVIQTHRKASFTGAVRHEAFVCDDLIAAIREAKP